MGKAWTDAVGMIGSNRDTLLAIAGLFFFLPSLALALIVPEAMQPAPVEAPPGTDPQIVMNAAVEALKQHYIDNWPFFLAIILAQYVGTLSLLALLIDHKRPTVGEALQIGFKSTPSYIATTLLMALMAALVIGLRSDWSARFCQSPLARCSV